MSSENFKYQHLNTPDTICSLRLIEELGPTSLSLVSVHFDVSTSVVGLIDVRCPPDCIKSIPITYQTWTSHSQVPIKINPSFNGFDDSYKQIALKGVLLKIASQHENRPRQRKFPSLSYDRDIVKVPRGLHELISEWSELPGERVIQKVLSL